VTAYIDQLGQHLANHSQRGNITYHFKVVNTDVVNAFAVPGGYLYVNIGLIRAAENESELAGVIGHEIGHVVGKHGVKQMTRQLGLAAVAQLALGENQSKLE
jgi:predicted Zn-dependent protease